MIESGRILPGKILVKPIEEKKQTNTGIIIPTEVIKPKTYAGEVVLVSTDPSKEQIVFVGDKILHPPHAFVNVTIDGEDLRLLNQTDILFIWR